MKYDFSGWATRNDVRCSDGRTIRRDAFKDCDGNTVPLVWDHKHEGPENVVGHALLKNMPQGVYTYGVFNETENGLRAKELVRNGDITSLSIFANHLRQNGGDVVHGAIREVSLVLAGANPEAFIDSVMIHSDDDDDEAAIIWTGVHDDKEDDDMLNYINHADDEEPAGEKGQTGGKEKTVGDVFNELTEEQKTVVYALIGQAVENAKNEKDTGDDEDMKHNVFDSSFDNEENTLSHSDIEAIFSDAKRLGSMKESVLQHGIDNIEYLFPDDHNLDTPPQWIKREDGWVSVVMNGVHHTPFSRIKSQYADLTEDEARAKGYIKGNMKKEQFFGVAKRSTAPTTVYKKQKLDRDDVIDITDFDVVAWIKGEMRGQLNEELARAFLVSDGRDPSSDDKINEQNIRP
ncbi:MAG: phage major capsid protein, partial [Ruminococcus sp.]|nr:phage major capsid protein [Ruminococcus sp.]